MRLFSGQSAWVLQRLSAVVGLLFLLLGLVALLFKPSGFDAWRALVLTPHGSVLIVITFIALCVHGWIGARDIVLDYIHAPALRIAILTGVSIFLLGVVVRVVLSLAAAFATIA